MKGRYRETLEHLGLVVQLGLTLVVAILLGFYAGQWMDSRLDTGMAFTIVGLLLGIGAGFRSSYEVLKGSLTRSQRKGDDE